MIIDALRNGPLRRTREPLGAGGVRTRSARPAFGAADRRSHASAERSVAPPPGAQRGRIVAKAFVASLQKRLSHRHAAPLQSPTTNPPHPPVQHAAHRPCATADADMWQRVSPPTPGALSVAGPSPVPEQM
jgi:hypothetical protein